MQNRETLALVALLQQDKAKWSDIRMQLEETAATELLLRTSNATLLDDPVAESIAAAEEQISGWTRSGIHVDSIYDAAYPAQLRMVHDFPPLLFSKGSFDESDDQAVAIVGTRNPSNGALGFIQEVVPMIAHRGHSIVSGLARGVDTAAMRASLDAGNRTVGVVGTGIRRYYPAENREIQDEVAANHLLLSQFWPDAPPTRQSFPMRNVVMSGFSGLTLIVEAGENSGTRIQARAATKHGRPLIISRAVYLQTRWGKDLVDRGLDVTVVGNAREAVSAVEAILGRRRAAESRPPLALSAAGV